MLLNHPSVIVHSRNNNAPSLSRLLAGLRKLLFVCKESLNLHPKSSAYAPLLLASLGGPTAARIAETSSTFCTKAFEGPRLPLERLDSTIIMMSSKPSIRTSALSTIHTELRKTFLLLPFVFFVSTSNCQVFPAL